MGRFSRPQANAAKTADNTGKMAVRHWNPCSYMTHTASRTFKAVKAQQTKRICCR